MAKKGDGKLVGKIFLMVALLISSVAGFFFWSTQDRLQSCQRSPGKVIELRQTPMTRYPLPVIQFETADHKIITAMSKFGSNPPAHQVSDSVTVLYRAESPEDISLDDPLELWFVPCLLGGMALIFLIVGGALVAFSKR